MTDRPKILLTRHWPDLVERHLAESYEVTFNQSDQPMDEAALKLAMRDYDALCPTVSDAITAHILETTRSRVQIVANYGVGINHIDISAAQRSEIAVTNTPDVLTNSTADLALMLMLMAARRAGEGERELRAGLWSGWRPTHLLGTELSGKTLALVGFGRIAQATARRAHFGFGMKIIYYSRRAADKSAESEVGAFFEPDLHTLLRKGDFVSLHVPGGQNTYGLIDAAAIAQMQPHAILINTARGDVLDNVALASALAEQRIASAGLDVYPAEPHIPTELLALDNVVLLPHLGSATAETRIAMGMRVAANLDAHFGGYPLPDRIV